SDGMSRLWPTVGALAGYGLCFYLLSVTMKSVPTGVAYAIWSGVGIVLISLIVLVVFKQRLDAPALAGIALMLGTVVLFKMKRDRYAWVTAVPAVWLLICTTYAGFIKIFDSNPAQGFLAQAHKFQAALASDTIT
ncbi:multidrug efflux SMR transporter, partial [Mesorhizobium sp. M8A.F.Ca.ET.207.01.1.1]|uniref:DMT family transporter n=1 Tax=Mesorhizobium sp. M8A.F.Ca.ET.207.01.1.1 TaxID=2563968 RepID=UPI001AEEB3FD